MKRHSFSIQVKDVEHFKNQLLRACDKHDFCSFLDSNNHRQKHSTYDWIIAYKALEVVSIKNSDLRDIQIWHNQNNDWLFGHFSYDLKNELHNLTSRNADDFEFSDSLFFNPATVVYSKSGAITVESKVYKDEASFLKSLEINKATNAKQASIKLEAKTTKTEYLEKIKSIINHLNYGNIYELNYCIEFSTQASDFDCINTFQKLNNSAEAPFSAYYKNKEQYLLCASPERYLKKEGTKIISQPIKGTASRSNNKAEDEELKTLLAQSEKEKSENVMIVDLVRNDLSRTAKIGSVKVDELFGTYTFNTVHHLISTISSELKDNAHLTDTIATSFPMGSMTGAPKLKAMQLIDEHENFKRSIYSGAVGYISPNGNSDFNVVIRALLFNKKTSYLSARVGSAITVHCNPELEYKECLLKAQNLIATLQ